VAKRAGGGEVRRFALTVGPLAASVARLAGSFATAILLLCSGSVTGRLNDDELKALD
jgi:hypothetical protein